MSLRFIRCRRGCPGFSLVEILVTLAVSGILAALLFPVVKGSIAKAKSATCMTNLKSLGVAFQLYSAENDNTLPPSYVVGSNAADNNWWFRVSPYTDARPMEKNWASVSTRSMEKPFHCPLVKNPDPAIGGNAWVSYKMNVQFRLQTSGDKLGVTTGAFRSRISQPSKALLLAEGRQHPEFSERTTNSIPWGVQFPHGNRMNGLFADGHVEALTPEMLDARWEEIYRYPLGK